MRKKKWRRSFWPTFLIILVLYQHCLLYPANCDLLKHCCTFVEIHPSLRNPGSFIRKDFSAKTEKIFLGRKLVKAVISSEDNQTMGNFHREAKRRFSRGIKVGKNRPTRKGKTHFRSASYRCSCWICPPRCNCRNFGN